MHGVTPPAPVFVTWGERQGRSAALADRLGADMILVPSRLPRSSWTLPVRHTGAAFVTIAKLFRRPLTGIVVQQPPVTLLAVAHALARLRGVPLISDFHSGTFEDPRWRWALPMTLRLSRRCSLTVVTNRVHREILESVGARVVELHDPPEDPHFDVARELPGRILVPASWGIDEPLEEIFQAAECLPEFEFHVTGRSAAEVPDLPNLVTTGYLSESGFRREFEEASVILCLTRHPNTMQRGGYEALSGCKPLVTSDQEVLRAYFGPAAVYAQPNADSIASAVRSALAKRDDLRTAITLLKVAKKIAFEDALAEIKDSL